MNMNTNLELDFLFLRDLIIKVVEENQQIGIVLVELIPNGRSVCSFRGREFIVDGQQILYIIGYRISCGY